MVETTSEKKLKARIEELEMQNEKVLKELGVFSGELFMARQKIKGLEAELKAYKEGIPIEEAPIDGTPILAWKSGSKYHPIVQHNEDGQWGRLTETFDFIASDEQPDRFIYLPPQQGGE